MASLHVFELLKRKTADAVPPVCAAAGDDAFLRRLAIAELRRRVLGSDEGEFNLTSFSGSEAEPRDVFDELGTMALFGAEQRRLVIVEDADDFVKRHRSQLEDYVARPSRSGVLLLDVSSLPSNTRLFKVVAAEGLHVDCKTPAQAQVLKWLIHWTKQHHEAKLDPLAAEVLYETAGPELGLVDMELAKLASASGPDRQITPELVDQYVGGWRVRKTWDMLDDALAGRAPSALEQLERLLLGGENPIGLLAQIGSTLRRMAATARLVEAAEAEGRKVMVRQLLQEAGFTPKPFILNKAEQQLRQLGRKRAAALYEQLLEMDLALKGTASSPARARLELEKLIARLSQQADPRRAAAAR